jgi:threonine dehydratase
MSTDTTIPTYFPTLSAIGDAQKRLSKIIRKTPLEQHFGFSETFEAEIFLKREDLQQVRSYKIRGAYNKMAGLDKTAIPNGIVCASAGNHAQGVALSCAQLNILGTIFMPTPTPNQKIKKVRQFGQGKVEVVLIGDTFDDANQAAQDFCKEKNAVYIPPFDDEKIIEGQGTIGMEILQQFAGRVDYLFLPIGGGGLSAGVSSVFRQISPSTKIIGVEPLGAAAMYESIRQNELVTLENIDKFVDGAAVKRVGELNFNICKNTLTEVARVHEGKVCETMLQLYNEDAMVVEPAGALTLAVLDQYKEEIKGKTVVCVVSGSNNDISRTAEIQERALLHRGIKHYFIINFPQRAGALREFVTDILGPDDDIVYFEYAKKGNQETGAALVGVLLKRPIDLQPLMDRMISQNFFGEYLNDKPNLFRYIL